MRTTTSDQGGHVVDRVPAEVFSPGEYLREELEARNWTQVEFAEIIGRPPRLVNEIIAGKRGITAATAKEIGAALGTSALFWLNLEAAYQLGRGEPAPARISQEARLRERYPVREMLKRGWIDAGSSAENLETNLLRFLQKDSLDDPPRLAHAARKTDYAVESPVQEAWICRVHQIARAMQTRPYSPKALKAAIATLRNHMLEPEGVREVPRILAKAGVQFVVVEALPGSKIDGACLWLDTPTATPVVGMSLRFDRIDNFWFVLRHELEHVLNRDGQESPIIDSDIGEATQEVLGAKILPADEIAANDEAAEFMVSSADLTDFLDRVPPAYWENRVPGFASTINVHPGIVVGRLQRRTGQYNILRRHLVKIRHHIVPESMCDGFGQMCPV